MTSHAVSDEALDIIFRDAHTQNKWTDKPVSHAMLMAIYDLMRWGPTSANASPARFCFLTSHAAKHRLKPHLAAGNALVLDNAPVAVLLAVLPANRRA